MISENLQADNFGIFAEKVTQIYDLIIKTVTD